MLWEGKLALINLREMGRKKHIVLNYACSWIRRTIFLTQDLFKKDLLWLFIMSYNYTVKILFNFLFCYFVCLI
jgi:hypothetical protein